MQPIVIQDAISIAANSINNNVIASNTSLQALRRLPFPAKITLAMVQSATGLSMDLDVGQSNVVAASNGRVSASSPQIPLDVVNSEAYGAEGDLITLRAANTTGGALTLRYMIIAEPLAEPGVSVQLPPNTVVMVQGPTSIAANAVDTQLLNGLRYERPGVDSIMDVLMASSAAGLTRTIYVDNERVAPPSVISLENQIPRDPFEMTVSGVEVPADKEIQIAISNTTAGALNVFWKLILRGLYRQ